MSYGKENLVLTTEGFIDLFSLCQREYVEILSNAGVIYAKVLINENLLPIRKVTYTNGMEINCGLKNFLPIKKGSEIDKLVPPDSGRSKEGILPFLLRGIRKGFELETGEAKPIHFIQEFNSPFIHGYCCAMGYRFCEGENKGFILDFPPPEIINHPEMMKENDKIIIPKNMINDYVVPFNSNLSTKITWLQGLFYGNVILKNDFVIFYKDNHNFLKNVQLLLFTLGVNCYLRKGKKIKIDFHEYNKLIELGFSGIKMPETEKKFTNNFSNISDPFQMGETLRFEKFPQFKNEVHLINMNGVLVFI